MISLMENREAHPERMLTFENKFDINTKCFNLTIVDLFQKKNFFKILEKINFLTFPAFF